MPMPYDLYGNPVGQQNPNSVYTPGLMSNGKQNMLQNNFLNPTQYGNANIYTPQFNGQSSGGASPSPFHFTPVSHTINDYPVKNPVNPFFNPDQQLNPYIGGTFDLMSLLRPDTVNGFDPTQPIPTTNPYMQPRNNPNIQRPNFNPQPMPQQGQPQPVPIKDPRMMTTQPTMTPVTQQLVASALRDQILQSLMQNPGQFNFNPTRMF